MSNLRITPLKRVAIIPLCVTAKLRIRIHGVWHHPWYVKNSVGACFEPIVAAYLSVSRVVVLLWDIPRVSWVLVESFIVGILSSASRKHWPIRNSGRTLIIVKLIAGRTLW